MGRQRPGRPPEKRRDKIVGMRPRRFVGILERALLGTAMSVVLSIVERRLRRRGIGATQDAHQDRRRRE